MKAMLYTRVIAAMVVMIAAFGVNNAVAQKSIVGDTNNASACWAHLKNASTDTIVSRSTDPQGNTIVRKVFLQDGVVSSTALTGKTTVIKHREEVREVVDSAAVAALDSAAVRLNTHLMLSDATAVNGFTHDIYFVNSEDAREYRLSKGDSTFVNAGKIPVRWAKKYGFHVMGTVGWGGNSSVNGFVGGIGVRYDRRWWRVDLEGQVAKSKLSSAAEHAGDAYWVYRTQATVGFRPFQLDRDDVNRLFIYGGLGFEFYKTDSKVYEDGTYYRSWGNYLYGVAGLAWQHRFFATGQSIEFGVEYHTSGAVRQNDSFENSGTFVGKITYTFNVFPNKTNYGIKAK